VREKVGKEKFLMQKASIDMTNSGLSDKTKQKIVFGGK